MKIMIAAAGACILAGSVQAQTASPAAPQTQTGSSSAPAAPSLTTSATTMAPVAPGSTRMHKVPTPVTAKRAVSSQTGGGHVGGGAN